ncbi:uncharacterized protein LOC122067525 [Macadamia integrifolia]|uniref:uncharacterized protein LOC122067525 n=1 Tax=Macadamia integrifolia TaxID=60698 RepID=UPI001C4F2B62|nr:uncharacterized protein LOC122067525 [Macadamia integrifolia]
MVWIRLPDLPLEYWHEKILLTLAKAVGRPMAIDKHTRAVLMGGYARIQVEVEVGSTRIDEIHRKKAKAQGIPGAVDKDNPNLNSIHEEAQIQSEAERFSHGGDAGAAQGNDMHSQDGGAVQESDSAAANQEVHDWHPSHSGLSKESLNESPHGSSHGSGSSSPHSQPSRSSHVSNSLRDHGPPSQDLMAENIITSIPSTSLRGGAVEVLHEEIVMADELLAVAEIETRTKEKGAVSSFEQTRRKSSVHTALRKIISDKSPDILYLAEPMIDPSSYPARFFSKLGFEADLISNLRRDKPPNLWLLWRQGISKPSILSFSEQKITIRIDWKGTSILISSIHASCFRASRRDLWVELGSVSILAEPWLVVGDFNATLASHEKRGPGLFNIGSAAEFEAMVDSCSLIKLPSQGPKYTWSNNRRRGNVAAVLDRGFCNEDWMTHFQDCAQLVLPRDFLDHNPILITLEACLKPKNCPFHFHKFWTDYPSFLQLVSDSWNEGISGRPTFVLTQKLKRLKPIIRTWARETFPNFEHELVRTREVLDQIQSQIEQYGMDDDQFRQEAYTKSAHLVALKKHEKLWAEKLRIKWLKEGDRNSKFFHLYTKIKRAKNTIRRVKKTDGSIISDRDEIANYMIGFYEEFHKCVPVTDHLELLDSIPRLIDQVDLLNLDAIPGPNEIKRAVWDLDLDSSPGPDGFPGFFFRCCWEIISRDFEIAIRNFFVTGSMHLSLNNNFLALIPIVNGAMTLDKLRPLCMGNFICKVISKILATRLSFLLPRHISEE